MGIKKNTDFLFDPDSQNFRKVQGSILTTDTTENKFMPSDPRIERSKSLNTTRKNVVGAINEVFDLAYEARQQNSGELPVIKTVNGKNPDETGNVKIDTVSFANRALADARGSIIHQHYLPNAALSSIIGKQIRTINGVAPDDQGNFAIRFTQSVNNIHPDMNGNVEIPLDKYTTQEAVTKEITKAIDDKLSQINKLTVNGIAADENTDIKINTVAHSDKADNADFAKECYQAESAKKSDEATKAVTADFSDKALRDDEGNMIKKTYIQKEKIYLKSEVDERINRAADNILEKITQLTARIEALEKKG